MARPKSSDPKDGTFIVRARAADVAYWKVCAAERGISIAEAVRVALELEFGTAMRPKRTKRKGTIR